MGSRKRKRKASRCEQLATTKIPGVRLKSVFNVLLFLLMLFKFVMFFFLKSVVHGPLSYMILRLLVLISD